MGGTAVFLHCHPHGSLYSGPHDLFSPSSVQEALFAGAFWPGFVQTPAAAAASAAAAAAVRPEVRQVPGTECCLPTEGKLTEECMLFCSGQTL